MSSKPLATRGPKGASLAALCLWVLFACSLESHRGSQEVGTHGDALEGSDLARICPWAEARFVGAFPEGQSLVCAGGVE